MAPPESIPPRPSVVLSGIPAPAFATPTYDPVFYYYHPDHLGSAQLAKRGTGTFCAAGCTCPPLSQHYGYHTYGSERYRDNTSAFSVSSRYTGQTLDEDTGLYYYGTRYYDPEVARFIQADSTIPDPEFSQAYNRYAYVYNNPLKFSDPTGQNPLLLVAFMIKGALIGGAVGAGVSAIMGGDPLKGFIAGAIGGAFGGIGAFAGWGPVGMGLMGAAGGALGAVATGGDPVMGALAGGITAGVMAGMGFAPITSFADLFTMQALNQLVMSTTIGAWMGGIAAELGGGEFRQGAAYGAAGAAAGFVMSVSVGQFVEPVVESAIMQVAGVIDIGVAFVKDLALGPLDTLYLRGGRSGGGAWRTITVKAYRLMDKIGFLWTPLRDEFHCSLHALNGIRAEKLASSGSPVTHYTNPHSWSGIAGHEIGHTTQMPRIPIVGELIYYLTVVPMSFMHHTLRSGFGIQHTPIISHFERDASKHGVYGGIK